MVSRRAFLKLSVVPGLAAVFGLPQLSVAQRFRILLPADADPEPLAAIAATLGRALWPTFYTEHPGNYLAETAFHLLSLPVPSVPRWIQENRLLQLTALTPNGLGPNWGPGRRPHDLVNAFTVPRDWGYVILGSHRRPHTTRPAASLLWAEDWAVPANGPDPALSTDFLLRWLGLPQAADLAASKPPPRSELAGPLRFAEPGSYRIVPPPVLRES